MYGLYAMRLDPVAKRSYLVASSKNVSKFNYFKRSTIKELMLFSARESTPMLPRDQQFILEIQDQICFAKRDFRDLTIFVFCHNAFDERQAISIQRKFRLIVMNYLAQKRIPLKQISTDLGVKHARFDELLVYGNGQFRVKVGKKPSSKETKVLKHFGQLEDPLAKARVLAESNKKIIRENLVKMLENNEDFDQLLKDSKDLREQTKKFYNNSKGMKGCSC